MAIESRWMSMRKSWEDTDFAFWPAMRWMHLHNRLCFQTGYDTISWLGGFACLVRAYEEAELLYPQAFWLSGEKYPIIRVDAADLQAQFADLHLHMRRTKWPSLSFCSKLSDLIFLGNLVFSWMPKLMLRHHGKESHKDFKRLFASQKHPQFSSYMLI